MVPILTTVFICLFFAAGVETKPCGEKTTRLILVTVHVKIFQVPIESTRTELDARRLYSVQDKTATRTSLSKKRRVKVLASGVCESPHLVTDIRLRF
jgi:hypothetical protein